MNTSQLHTPRSIPVVAASGLSAKTLNVQQLPSIFSTLNTVDVAAGVTSLVVGALQGVNPPLLQVYSITGLVL